MPTDPATTSATTTSTNNIAQVQREVKDKLLQISSSFIEPTYQKNLAFVGTTNNTNFFQERIGSPSNLSYFVPVLFTGFRDNGAIQGFNTIYGSGISNSTPNNISTRTLNTNNLYNELQLDGASNSFSSYRLNSNTEISLKNYVNPSSALGCNLQNIRMLYSLLDDTNYKNYVYMLNNPNTSGATIRLTTYFSSDITEITSTTNPLFDRMKDMILNLKGISVLTTNTLLTTNRTNITPLVTVNSSNDYFLPKETIGDKVVEFSPSGINSQSYIGDLNVDTNIPGDGSTTRYYTVSFYAKMRNNSTDANSADLVCAFLMGDDSSNSTSANEKLATSSIPYSTTFSDTISPEWTRITHTVSYNLPSTSIGKLQFRLYIDHQNATNAAQQVVQLTGLQSSFSTTQPNDENSFILPQFDDSRTSRIVIRRLLLLYELLATYYIAGFIKNANMTASSTATENVTQKKATALINLVYEYITNYNRNIIRNDNGKNFIGGLSTEVANQFSTYAANTNSLTRLGNTMKDNQYTLKSNISTMNAQKKVDEKTKLYKYIALVIFIIVLLACVVVYVIPLDGKKKILAALTVGSVGIVTIMIFLFIYSQNVEQFQASNLLQDPYKYAGGISILDNSDFQADLGIVAVSFANDYLANTIQIALMIQTYVGYGNINFALSKDITRYNDINTQLTTSSVKINSATNIYTLNKYSNRAFVSLVVTIGILAALTVATLVMTNNHPGLKVWILVASGFILFLAIVFYMLDTSARVRTSASKKYWGTPNLTGL